MEGEELVRVQVELRHTGKTVSGQVAVEGAAPSGFFGWLELIDRLEQAAGKRARATQDGGPEGDMR